MKISLVRHGRPKANLASRIRAKDFPVWLGTYDQSGIDDSLPPPRALGEALATCMLVVTSPARRATESADALGLRAERRILIDANEAPLPTRIFWPFPLRPTTFSVMARILWLSGVARAKENKEAAQVRAHTLALQLFALSGDFGHVALVGHGYMNILLRDKLARAGWHSSGSRRNGYWSCCHFEKKEVNRPPSLNPDHGR